MQLFINTPGTMVKQKEDCFCVMREDQKKEISPQKVESIVFTDPNLHLTFGFQIPLHF